MRRATRTNLVLAALAVLLGLLAWRQVRDEVAMREPPLAAIDADAVTRIRVQCAGCIERRFLRTPQGWRMTAPYDLDADPLAIARLLAIASAPVRLREPAAAYDAAKIGLDPPVMELELDDVRIDIGDTDALRGDRYVRDGEHIARVADRFSPFLMATPESELERRTVPRDVAIVHLRVDGAEVAAAKIAAWQAMPVAKITAIDAADIRTAQHVVEVELADGTRIAWQLGHAADGWIARRTSPPLDYHLDARAVERFLAADADRDGD